jgi:hypothetical protein
MPENTQGLAVIPIAMSLTLMQALYRYCKEHNYKPETIVAEALRAYMGDAV